MQGKKTNNSRFGDAVATGLSVALVVALALTFATRKRHQTTDAARVLTGHAGGAARAVEVQPVRAELTERGCYAALRAAGVGYRSIARGDAGTVEWPIVLTGPIDGVRVHGSGKVDAPTNYLDCRLARALLSWAPRLRATGIVGLEHYSMYRPESVVGRTSKPSGHSTGCAIDLAKIELRDGRVLSVLDAWKNRARGADPCRTWPDAAGGRMLRELVCEAGARGLFQTIVTPHHNDAHANHVHLEIGPADSSLWIH